MSPLLIIGGAIGLLMVVGAGVAFFAGSGQAAVDERLEEFVGGATVVVVPESESQDKTDFRDKLDKSISKRPFFSRYKDMLSRADSKLRVSEFIIFNILLAIAAPVIAYLWKGDYLIAAGAFLFGWKFPGWYQRNAAKTRITAYNNQLGDTLNLWVNALKAGSSVLQGMETIATESDPPISHEFERVVQEVRLGLSMTQAMDNMYRRVPSEDLDLVITAVNIQREVGGNLAEVLDNISFTIRERIRIKGEIRTLTAQGRIGGIIISLLPVVLGALLYFINPEYISELWVKEPPFIIPDVFPCGWIVIGVGLGMIGLGAFAISKIVDIEV